MWRYLLAVLSIWFVWCSCAVDFNSYQAQEVHYIHPRAELVSELNHSLIIYDMTWHIIGTFGVGFYTESLMAGLEVDRTTISSVWMTALFSCAALLPFVGRIVDRFGPRIVGLTMCVPLFSSLLLMSYAENIWVLGIALIVLRLTINTLQLTSATLTNQKQSTWPSAIWRKRSCGWEWYLPNFNCPSRRLPSSM